MAEIAMMHPERTLRLILEPDIRALLEKTERRADGACLLEYEQISEKQFLTYLRDGWQIGHKLQNGDFIVKR